MMKNGTEGLVAALVAANPERWFTGKAKEKALAALALVEESLVRGYWLPKVSRLVHAALNKQNVAIKFARANEAPHNRPYNEPALRGILSSVESAERDERTTYTAKYRGWNLVHYMMFGQVTRAAEAVELAAALEPYCQNDAERAALKTAAEWAADFAPVAAALAELDSRRPVPVVVMKTLSPTVVANLAASMKVDLTSVASPDTEVEWVERVIKGQTVKVAKVKILWPEGTRHNCSRFAYGTDNNAQCHACGHAIKNPWNWVPLVATTPTGPVSLWVGKDCAKKLFGCEVSGEAEYVR
jgi:hypothetical protein